MSGRIIDKVGVKVIPDTSSFVGDLRKYLARIEHTLKVEIPTSLDLTGVKEDLAQIRAAVASQRAVKVPTELGDPGQVNEKVLKPVKVPTRLEDPDTALFTTRLRGDIAKALAGVDAKVPATIEGEKLRVDAAVAARQAQSVLDRMKAKLPVELGERAKLRAEALAAVEEVNAIARSNPAKIPMEADKRSLPGLFKGLKVPRPQPVLIAVAVAGIAAALPQLLALSGSLSQVSLAAIALPGVLAGAATGFAAVGVGLSGFGKAMSSMGKPEKFAEALKTLAPAAQETAKAVQALGPAWGAMRTQVQGALFTGIAGTLTTLSAAVLPTLRSGLTANAAAANGLAKAFAGAVAAQAQSGDMSTVMSRNATALQNMRAAVAPLVQAFGSLAVVGSSVLPSMGTAIANAAQGFATFIENARQTGQLASWMQTGIGALQMLGSVVVSVAGIFKGLVTAAMNAGGATASLGGMAGVLQGVAAAVNQPAFQTGLTAFFTGINQGTAGVMTALPAIGSAFAALGPVIGQVAAIVGPVLGVALQQVASILQALAPALTPVVAAIASGLTPALQVVGPALAGLASALGPILTMLGQLVGSVLTALGPALATVIGAITNVVTALQPVLSAILPALQAILPWIVTFLGGVLAAAINGIASVITGVFTAISGIWNTFKAVFTGDWAGAWNGIKQVASGVWQAILGAFQVWMNVGILSIFRGGMSALAANWRVGWDAIKSVGSASMGALKGLITSGLGAIRGQFTTVWAAIRALVTTAINAVRASITSGMNSARAVVSSATSAMKSLFSSAWSGIVSAVRSSVSSLLGVVRGIPGGIRSALGNMGGLLVGAGRQVIQGLINGIRSMASAAAAAAASAVSSAISAAKGALGIHSPSRVFDQIGRYTVAGFVQGVTGTTSQATAAIRKMAGLVTAAGQTIGRASVPASKTKAIATATAAVAAATKKLNAAQASVKTAKTASAKKTAAARVAAARTSVAAATRQLAAAKKSASAAGVQMSADARTLASVQRIQKTYAPTLTKVTAARDQVATRLKDAQTKLSDLQAAKAKYVGDTMKTITEAVAISTNDTTATGLEARLTQQVAVIEKWRANIAALVKKGVDKTTIAQLVDLGPFDSYALTQSLTTASAAQIKSIGTLQGKVVAAASSTANQMGSLMYDAGIKAAQGIVQGLTSQQSAITKTLTTVANQMAAAIKKALGIRSPSRVFAQVGEDTIAGLVNGLAGARGLTNVDRAVATVADRIAGARMPLPVDLPSGYATPTPGTPLQVNFNGNVGWDPDEVAYRIDSRLGDSLALAGQIR